VHLSSLRSWSSVVFSLAAGGLSLLGVALPASAQTSTERNPVFTFSTPGIKQVTLESCNQAGCTQVTHNVTVLDPAPVIDSAAVGPLAIEAGRLVKLTGSGHGQPPLGYNWRVAQGTGIPLGASVTEAPGATAWWDTSGMAPGVYSVQLDLSNAVGPTASSVPALVTVLPAAGSDFYTVTPCRAYNSRTADDGALASGALRLIDVAAAGCGIPAGAEAISANVTVVGPTGTGHLLLYPGNYPKPATSTVNFAAGQTRANDAILPLASDGTGTLAAEPFVLGGGSVHVLLDVNGYFL
jgi:hypothetical protein